MSDRDARLCSRFFGGWSMVSYLYTNVELLRIIVAEQLPYKTGLAKLFQSQIAFNPLLAQADFDAIECDFTGYAAITETTLPDPYLDNVRGGVSFQVPTLQYNTGNAPVTGNDVWGGWFETAGGVLLCAWQLAVSKPMNAIDQSLPIDLIINFNGNAGNQVYVSINGVPQ